MTDLSADLLARWLAVAGRVGAGALAAAVGRRLVDAYASPARGYHDLRHLDEVLAHLDELADEATDPDALDTVRLAAWFHDAVYDGRPGDEERSAELAWALLGPLGVPEGRVAEVARLVLLTATHDPADDDADGAVLCDADLAVLARDAEGYAAYVAGVRREYAHVPDAVFRAGRAAVLRDLATRDPLFRTPTGRARWEQAARHNLAGELAGSTSGG
ncbi:MAG: HD domain-containing protein [Nocardioidaceae bacterium]